MRWLSRNFEKNMSLSSHADEHARPGKRRWLPGITLALMAGLGVAAVVWSLWPAPKLTVRTLVHVPPNKPWLQRAAGGAPDLQNHQRTQAALVKSRLVLQAALRDQRVAALPMVAQHADPVEWLEREVQADFTVAPEILRIAMSGDRPDDLVVLVNALREAYLREILEPETTQRRERLNKLGEMREKFESQLRASRKDQTALEQKAGAKDAGGQLKVFREDLRHVEELIKKVAAEEAALEVELAAPKREQVLEPAVVPHRATPPWRITTAGLAGLACALLTFACLALAPLVPPVARRSVGRGD
jgi:hypothetical protein